MKLHLVHAALVHIPVAFLVVGGLLEAGALVGRWPGAARFGGALVLLGAIALVPTIVAGIVAENIVTVSAQALGTLEAHERNAWILLGTLVALVAAKAWQRGQVPERLRLVYALGLLVTVALVLWGAWLGGRLVYGYGVGVGVG